MFVYIIVCTASLKLYIGQHRGCDLQQYLRSKWYAAHHRVWEKSHLYAAMRKHPRETWSIWPLVAGIDNRAELNELEKHFIRALKTQHSDIGYNICRGGEGFTGPHTQISRRRMSRKIKASYLRRGHAEHQKRSTQARIRWENPEFRQRVRDIQRKTPNRGRFQKGHKPSPRAGLHGPNQTSFTKGHKPWNTGTRGVVKPNSGSFGFRNPN